MSESKSTEQPNTDERPASDARTAMYDGPDEERNVDAERAPGVRCDDPDSLCDTAGHELTE